MHQIGELGTDIKLLANLFKETRRANGEESSSDEENAPTVKSSVTPSSIGKQKKGKESVYKKVCDPNKLTEEEFEKSQQTLLEASREKPHYEISYKQAVRSEDVFLQMGGKTPATASCEDMVLVIYMPGEDRSAMDLNVNHTHIELTSPKYKLEMPFPHCVDPQRSSAKWDPHTEKLTLTLRLTREFDYVNF